MIFFDAHVHCYLEYNPDNLFDTFVKNATANSPQGSDLAMAFLLRSFQPDVLSAINKDLLKTWKFERFPTEETAGIVTNGKERILIFPARQVATKERIELLGFFGQTVIKDGLSIKETTKAISENGYAQVIAWGKGKWLFKRSSIVKSLIVDSSASPQKNFVCDSALRPRFWVEPLFRTACKCGLKLIYGSDPLPRTNDEHKVGSYATLIDAPSTDSYKQMLSILSGENTLPCGQRSLS